MKRILILTALAALVLAGCGSVAKMGAQLGQGAGVLTEQQTQSINRSVDVLEKTFEDVTPEPSVVDAQQGSMRECSDAELDDDELDEPGPDTRVAGTPERVAARSVASEFDDDELDDDPDFDSDYDGVEAEYDDEHEPSVLQAKLGSAASQAGEIAKNTGTALKHVGASAASKVGGWIKSARHKKAAKAEARGQTAPATRKQGAGRRVRGRSPWGCG